jgi:hypothetical protein
MNQPPLPPGYPPQQPQNIGGAIQQYVQPQPIQQAPAPMPTGSVIPGVTVVHDSSGMVPQFLVIAREKTGKSTLGTTLVNWPRPGMHPLFFAFDTSGPNSCLKLGYQPHVMKVLQMPGIRTIEKTRDALTRLENNMVNLRQMYGSIIVDCASTMVDFLHEDGRKSKNPDPRSHFGDALMWSREVMHRLVQLGLPIWWLSWLREPETVEEKIGNDVKETKVKRLIPGGPNIIGNFKAVLSGKVQHIFILDKLNMGVTHPAADEDGFVRVFHTRDHMNVRAGGRFAHLLPPMMPAHCGQVLNLVMAAR